MFSVHTNPTFHSKTTNVPFHAITEQKRHSEEAFGMSRSSFASFHLTGIKPSSGKMMTSSVDRLFESDSDVFLSNNFNEFQVWTYLLLVQAAN